MRNNSDFLVYKVRHHLEQLPLLTRHVYMHRMVYANISVCTKLFQAGKEAADTHKERTMLRRVHRLCDGEIIHIWDIQPREVYRTNTITFSRHPNSMHDNSHLWVIVSFRQQRCVTSSHYALSLVCRCDNKDKERNVVHCLFSHHDIVSRICCNNDLFERHVLSSLQTVLISCIIIWIDFDTFLCCLSKTL